MVNKGDVRVIFLNNQNDIPDKFTTKIDTIYTNNKPKINDLIKA